MDSPCAELLFSLPPKELAQSAGERVLFIRAEATPALFKLPKERLVVSQSEKGKAAKLEALGLENQLSPAGEFDTVYLLPGKQRHENLFNFARAWKFLRPGGICLAAMPNELGSKRFEKHFKEIFEEFDSLSKHHARVFWGRRSSANTTNATVDEWLGLGGLQVCKVSGLMSQPGIFGWDKVDTGSELLARHLPTSLYGTGADLGAGYGFLSSHILRTNPNIQEFHLYENEFLGIEACKINTTTDHKAKLEYCWQDISRGIPKLRYDWIVTNPPFHSGKNSDFGVGRRFVQVAAESLKKGGELYMVSNLHLPYEAILRELFSEEKNLVRERGFKVLHARL